MQYNELISNSNLALGGGQYDTALAQAREAIKLEPGKVEAYYCAGKACMSMEQAEDAVGYFKKAVELEKHNGNAYFMLGYAQVYAGDSVEGLKSLTRAIERNCDASIKGQIYKMMSMINADQGDFENALANLKQAESFLGLDLEILQQQAACYTGLRKYHDAIFTLNQLKMVKPKVYQAYGLAFHIFMELGIFDEAKAELERAQKQGAMDMDYYNDRILYILEQKVQDGKEFDNRSRCKAVLTVIDEGLLKGQPSAEQAVELYIRAAQMYLAIETPAEAIGCLEAAENPILYFNGGFKTSVPFGPRRELNTEEISPEDEMCRLETTMEDDLLKEIEWKMTLAENRYGEYDAELATEAMEEYLSSMDKLPKEAQKSYRLEEEYMPSPMKKDMINSLYLAAYEMQKEYEKMRGKARELQSSNVVANQYSGIYYELKVGKYLNEEKWDIKYRDRINFWTKQMLLDPTDYLSAGFRIKSYIDIGDFKSADQLYNCLPLEVKKVLVEEMKKAREQGA